MLKAAALMLVRMLKAAYRYYGISLGDGGFMRGRNRRDDP